MQSHEFTFLGTFNARHLTPDEVARSFVPPPCFDQLAANSHVLLVGPRGSGKTTLLKMLQPQALQAWSHPTAARFREQVTYTAVFVPADISWGAQLDSLGYGMLSAENHTLLAQASFTTHVLRALLEGIAYRLRSDAHTGSAPDALHDAEASFVQEVAICWHVQPEIQSLLALKHALRRRLADIRTLANQGAHRDQQTLQAELSRLPMLHLHFLEAVGLGIEVIDDLLGQPNHKWALLFDELEIAPTWVQDEVLRSTRSIDPKLLIKLALSPCTASAKKLLESVLAPAPGHDLVQIPLWYAEKERGYNFCRELWAASLNSKSMPLKSAESVLGSSYFDPDNTSQSYAAGSKWAQRFVSLAEKDQTFAAYLQRNAIDPAHLDSADVATRDKIVRKAAPIVAVREFFRRSDESRQRRRTRKSGALYAGAESVFAITEGNPRWFKGIAGALIRHLENADAPIAENIQGQEITKTAERLLAMLVTVPTDAQLPKPTNGGRDVRTLLDRIGHYFADRVVIDEFNPEPPLSFRVDTSTDPDVLELLKIALNRGAIVLVPDSDTESIITSTLHHRFRLSYLLAAYYGLPLRLGKETPLSKVLRERSEKGAPASGDLFQETPQ